MVIFRFVTGSEDAAFRGFVNTFVVTRKPFRSKGSGCAMAAFLEAFREGNEKQEELEKGGCPAQQPGRQEVQENKTRIACGFWNSAPSVFFASRRL